MWWCSLNPIDSQIVDVANDIQRKTVRLRLEFDTRELDIQHGNRPVDLVM